MPDQNVQRNLLSRVNLGDLLLRSAARAPNHLALVDGERRITYRALNEWVNQVAHGLAGLGYQRGDRLALMSTNNPEFLATYFACAKLGVVCVPVNLFWRPNELAYVLGHAAVRGVLVEAPLLEQLGAALVETASVRDVFVIGGDAGEINGRRRLGFEPLHAGMPCSEPEALVEDRDPMSYIYTSGTTAAPKGVVTSHLALYLQSLGFALDTRMTSSDRLSAFMPFFHTAQLSMLATPALAVGATLFIQRGFDATGLLNLIETERLTYIFGLPMMYRAMLEQLERHGRDLSSLRLAIYAMAPMPVDELRKAMDVFGCEFSLAFGQTEMSPISTYFRPEHQFSHPGAVGTASVNVEVKIMDEAGNFLAAGQSGEIVYRSPQLLTGYLDNPEATDIACADGWFHSGDTGRFDDDGMLWFEDRSKDVIKTGGKNVASIEVEKALCAADARVQEAAVIGLPHDRWGEAVTAAVIVKSGEAIDEQMLLTKLRDQLSPYKCPKRIVFMEAFPKTATGKVQKAKLRAELAALYQTAG
jgi:acyl-CoA synthetase (AMP-forming)/AMP-acid ligase II